MDHQKIVGQAKEAHGVKTAVQFLEDHRSELDANLMLASLGTIANEVGGRRACTYLAQAIEIYRVEMVTYAIEKAKADLRKAEAEIRRELEE